MSRRMSIVIVFMALMWVLWVAPALAEDDTATREMVRQEIEAWQKEHVKPNDFRVYWKNGPTFETHDKRFKFGCHGRIMSDWVFFDDVEQNLEQAIGGEFHSGHAFRRAWLTFNGTAWKYVAWTAQYAFETNGGPGFLDVWVGLKGLHECLGCSFPDIRIGHYQEPFGLAWLTSSKYFQLMAWPTPTTTFTPGYNSGITLARQWYGDRVTARVGVFGNDGDMYGAHEWTDGYGITGRFTVLPWAPCNCDSRVLHLGVSASYRGDTRTARFRSRAGIDRGPAVIDTDVFPADHSFLLDLEAAWVYDRFNIQAEYMLAQVDADTGTDPLFSGFYVQAGYMLAGAPCRNYVKKSASFGQTKVCRPLLLDKCCGFGALELAARYSYVDLDDGDKQGGTSQDFSVGLNWYLNENARIMFNYVYADIENAYGSRNTPDSDGDVGAFAVRFQVHW